MRTDFFVESVFVSTSSVTAVTPSPVSGKVKVYVLPRLHPYRSPKLFSAFSFDAKGTKEKAWQKENADKRISPLRERPRLRLWNPQTFEKV